MLPDTGSITRLPKADYSFEKKFLFLSIEGRELPCNIYNVNNTINIPFLGPIKIRPSTENPAASQCQDHMSVSFICQGLHFWSEKFHQPKTKCSKNTVNRSLVGSLHWYYDAIFNMSKIIGRSIEMHQDLPVIFHRPVRLVRQFQTHWQNLKPSVREFWNKVSRLLRNITYNQRSKDSVQQTEENQIEVQTLGHTELLDVNRFNRTLERKYLLWT